MIIGTQVSLCLLCRCIVLLQKRTVLCRLHGDTLQKRTVQGRLHGATLEGPDESDTGQKDRTPDNTIRHRTIYGEPTCFQVSSDTGQTDGRTDNKGRSRSGCARVCMSNQLDGRDESRAKSGGLVETKKILSQIHVRLLY
jgi:hypothetical protein